MFSHDIEIPRDESGEKSGVRLSNPRDLPDDLDRLELASPKIVIDRG